MRAVEAISIHKREQLDSTHSKSAQATDTEKSTEALFPPLPPVHEIAITVQLLRRSALVIESLFGILALQKKSQSSNRLGTLVGRGLPFRMMGSFAQ